MPVPPEPPYNRPMPRRATAVLVTLLALAGARAPRAQSPAPPPDLERLVAVVHATHLFEIELGRLAAGRARNLRVRRFGQRLAADHRIADRKLLDLARKRGWRVATQTRSAEENRELERLAALPESEFDAAFVSGALEGHRETMQQLEAAGAAVADRALRRYLDVTMPILHQHWLLAARLRQPAPSERA